MDCVARLSSALNNWQLIKMELNIYYKAFPPPNADNKGSKLNADLRVPRC